MQDILASIEDLINSNLSISILVHVLLAVIMFFLFVQAGYSIGRFIYYLLH